MSKTEAKITFRALVAKHGLQWTAAQQIPQAHWDMLAEVNKVLDTGDRREALGLVRR